MLNRPKREDFKSHIEYDEFGELEFNGIDDYYDALEKYCDALETLYCDLVKTADSVSYYYEELDKALNNFAIEIINFPDEEIPIEVVCRKLHKCGLIKKENGNWVVEDE